MKSILDKKNNKIIGILFAIAGVFQLVTMFNIMSSIEPENIKWLFYAVALVVAFILAAAGFFLKSKMFVIISYLLFIARFAWQLIEAIGFLPEIISNLKFTDIVTDYFLNLFGDLAIIAAFALLLVKYINNNDNTLSAKICAAVMAAGAIVFMGILDGVLFSFPFIIAYIVPDNLGGSSVKAIVPNISLENELKELKTKYELNQISEEEYNQKKAEILAKL